MSVTILDLTPKQSNPPRVAGKHRLRADGRVAIRNVKKTRGICIHQTACVFGPMSDPEARHLRALNVACHGLAFNDGTLALPNPIDWLVYHGNGFNDMGLGLEIEGHFPGVPDEPSTPKREDIESAWGGEPQRLTEIGLETARVGVRVLFEKGLQANMPIEFVWAHRQSNGSKPSDPGYEIWADVVLDYAVAVLGLKTQPGLTLDSPSSGRGRPIPRAWDPNGIGPYLK